ncbi:phosphate ABC transporter substrate-binding protein [Mesoplasma corruscae]|uniref:Phosphate ABC transporter substrate-binding protein n=1 Tax=Mesoplasma corruscae TaxID=216874 RepID=A0A2S5RGL0_9MOLU|nr:phosphate ABC transporter substrate-binding protein [Mesoplasma corruscae]PPE06440.1 phosphate ABC transporter substrate-binding protein [Mesoplasma corruscae]
MSKKLFLVLVIIIGAVIGLWTWTLAVPTNSISIGGSASVQPLLKKFTNEYKTEDKKYFVYSATGSGAGITNVKADVYETGFISKSINPADWEVQPVSENVNFFKDGAEKWTNDNQHSYSEFIKKDETIQNGTYRSIELAKDSFVFVYNDKGTGFDKFLDNTGIEFSFGITDENTIDEQGIEILKNIYQNNDTKELWTWKQLAKYLASKNPTKLNSQAEAEKVSNKKIIPYTSTSGSGTRSSFSNLTGGINPGQAAKEYNSNGAIYGQLIHSPGSIGFVSMLYGQNLTKDVKAVSVKKGEDTWNLNKNEEKNKEGYPLTRPFIAIIKVDKSNKNFWRALDFIFWMCASENSLKHYQDAGLQKTIKTKSS